MKHKKLSTICLLAVAIIIFVVIACLAGCNNKDKVKYDDAYEFTLREGCSDYYYSHLSENQQKMYRMLCKRAEDVLYNGQEKDTLGTYKFSQYGLSYDEAVTVWYAFRYDAPAYFIISNSYSYNRSSLTAKIAPEFTDKSVREGVLKAIENSVDEVRQLLDGIQASAMKFKVIYDYVMDHTEYNGNLGSPIFDGYSYSIAGPLDGDNRTHTICQGYAGAISYLCNLFGVKSIYVGSEYKEHALNIVNIDDNWYYTDATLDDSGSGSEEYQYFLLGDNYEWQMYSGQYDDVSGNYLRSVLPKLARNQYDTYSDKARNGDFYYSFDRTRGKYECGITGTWMNKTGAVVDGVESVDCIPTRVGVYEVTYLNFSYSSGLKSVKIPDGFIYGGSYDECSNLISIELPKSVERIGSFIGCSSLESIVVDADNAKYKSDGNCLIDRDTNTLILGCKNSVIPGYVTRIGEDAFRDCVGLTAINIPSSVTSIGDRAFMGCGNLTGANLPSGLQELGDYVYYNCKRLESVNIPYGIVNIGNYTFYECNSLKDIELPGSVIAIGDAAFFKCISLQNVKIPSGVVFIGLGAFANCNSLTSIEIPSGVSVINRAAFENCTSLRDVSLPSGVTVIDNYAFNGCAVLEDLEIPRGVTRIGYCAFQNCKSLKQTVIPAGVMQIESMAFYGCGSVYCESETKPTGWADDWKGYGWIEWGYKAS